MKYLLIIILILMSAPCFAAEGHISATVWQIIAHNPDGTVTATDGTGEIVCVPYKDGYRC